MQQVVDAAIKRVKKDEEKYADIDLDSLYVLQSELTIINLYEESI